MSVVFSLFELDCMFYQVSVKRTSSTTGTHDKMLEKGTIKEMATAIAKHMYAWSHWYGVHWTSESVVTHMIIRTVSRMRFYRRRDPKLL